VLIFRVENADGKGPYHTVITCHPGAPNHLTPTEDQDIGGAWGALWRAGNGEDYFFGFTAMSELLAWFHAPDWLRYAHKHGMAIHVYEIDGDAPNPSLPEYKCAYVGATQAIFRRDCAKRLYSIPLQSIIREPSCNP